MKSNLRKHELIGLLMTFLGATLIGFGVYSSIWVAVRPMVFGSYEHVLRGKEILMFPLFYGIGFVLMALGKIELKEALPGSKRK
jgi:hypothetical protein